MSFSDDIAAFDVSDYLSGITTLRRSGPGHHMAVCCPICGDSRGSKFYVNTSGTERNGAWNSYCCHDQGGLVDLIMKIEDITRAEAVHLVTFTVEGSNLGDIPLMTAAPTIPTITSAPLPTPAGIALPSPLVPATPSWPCVIRGRLATLADRGITQAVIDRHGLMVSLGETFCANTRGEVVRRRDLDNRLFIPVISADGTSLSWQARDLSGAAARKYVFPTGDTSSSTFYDLGSYLRRGGDTLLIVEGVVAKWAWDSLGERLGLPAVASMAVASFGKRLTKEQEALLVATTKAKRVIIGWDLDAATQVAAVAAKLSGRKELLVMPAHPSGRDHDELSPAELVETLRGAVPYSLDMMARLVLAGPSLLSAIGH